MSKWLIPNEGRVHLIVEKPEDKADLLAALKAARLTSDLGRFARLLESHIELEAELSEQRRAA